jgi:exodeoxyribonuclease V gamma subunit
MLVGAWVRSLAASACGVPARGVLVGRDATVTVEPLPAPEAAAALAALLQLWLEGMRAPLPLACRAGLALVAGASDVDRVYEGGPYRRGEVEEACLARLYADYAALCADGRFHGLAQCAYGPLLQWTRDRVSLELHEASASPADADEDDGDG